MARPSTDERISPPRDMAQTTPRYAQPGHDFTLQAVMELKGSVHELTAKVDRLVADVRGHGEKIDAIRMRMAWVGGGAAVLGFLAALGLGLLKVISINWPGSGP